MYNTKKIKNCSKFKAIDQSTGINAHSDTLGDCMNCRFFNSRNCGMESADEIDPLPGLWS